uniref:Uncharacterized protein n=1 Tax=Romanomermis culicivorax TaxID=13658 RepID=A0A915K6P6_ROMCU
MIIGIPTSFDQECADTLASVTQSLRTAHHRLTIAYIRLVERKQSIDVIGQLGNVLIGSGTILLLFVHKIDHMTLDRPRKHIVQKLPHARSSLILRVIV